MGKHLKIGSLLTAFFLLALMPNISFGVEESLPALLPVPSKVSWGNGSLAIDGGLKVEQRGVADTRLNRTVDRFLFRLEKHTGVPIRLLGQNNDVPKLIIDCAGPGESVQSASEDESYRLSVSVEGVSITAGTTVGVMRGLETLLQLVSLDENGWCIPVVMITDQPRFRWRGLLIDPCRHWLPQETIHRIIDVMSVVKLNVLHWHLTDDQGFRVESRRYPKLHEMGSDGFYYTQEQIRETIAYARDRGIRIVPEFDLPGHSTSWFVGYPELASAPGPYTISRILRRMDPAFDPTLEEIYEFLDGFIDEMAKLFPDEVIHIGGDEVTGKHWQENKAIQAYIEKHNLADANELQAYFTKRLADIVTRHGKRMMGWEEIQHSELKEGVIVQAWLEEESLIESVKNGHEGVLSWGYYLDHMFPAAFHYGVDPFEAAAGLTDEQRALILGGEACMWSELVTSENIDAVVWPRTAAIAERLWSNSEVRDIDDMYFRLEAIDRLLEEAGSTHRTGPRRMLERMVGSNDIETLELLVEVLEPPEFYARHFQREFDQTTPLNTLADTVPPESSRARQFGFAVDRLISNPSNQSTFEKVERWLTIWCGLEKELNQKIEKSPLLRGTERLTEALSNVSEIGLEAIGFLEKHEQPPEGWYQVQQAMLSNSFGTDKYISQMFTKRETISDIESIFANYATQKDPLPLQIAIVPSVERLVEAAERNVRNAH